MSNYFTSFQLDDGYVIKHKRSGKEILRGLSPWASRAALEELAKFDCDVEHPTDSRLGTWRGACRRAIARAEVKGC